MKSVGSYEAKTHLHGLLSQVEKGETITITKHTVSLARDHGVSAYDAAYLELAMRRGLPLATLDDKLKIAAQSVGVPLYGGASR